MPVFVCSLRLPALIFFCLFILGLSASARADSLPLKLMPDKSFADVQAEAQLEAVSGPVWGNSPDPATLPFHTSLMGTVTADSTLTKLAILSDDGCDVFVDGAKVWSAKDQGQALPDLGNSLHELPVTLTPGPHTVEIDYSNTVYTPPNPTTGQPTDIDGCTLFVYGVSDPTVTVTLGDLGEVITEIPSSSAVTASVDHLPGGYQAGDVTAQWSYDTVYIVYSGTGNDETWSDATDGTTASATLNGANSSPAGTFNGTFMTEGFYEVCIKATVTYHIDATGQNLGPYYGYGFVSSDDPSAEDSAGTPTRAATLNRSHGLPFHASASSTPTTSGKAKVRTLGKFVLKFRTSHMTASKTIDPYAFKVSGTPNKPTARIGILTGDDVILFADIGKTLDDYVGVFHWSGVVTGSSSIDNPGIIENKLFHTFNEPVNTYTEAVTYQGRKKIAVITTKSIPTETENEFGVLNYPASLDIKNTAEKLQAWMATNYGFFGNAPGVHNNRADAARHALWCALVTQKYNSALAIEAGYAHERDGLNAGTGRHNETVMDMENNIFGTNHPEWAALQSNFDNNYYVNLALVQAINTELGAGHLTILDDIANTDERGLLVPSNQEN